MPLRPDPPGSMKVDELVHMINYQFPQKLMSTSTRYPPAPPVPLDLGDIKKTQRRVAALMQAAHPQQGSGNGISNRHIPHSFCYVCSRLDPNGRFMGNPYKYLFGRGYLQRCEHVPPTPHPTMLNDTRVHSPATDDGKFFDTGVLNKDELPNSDKTRFKVSPAFDKDELRDMEEGRFLPLVSENTFLTTNPVVSKHKRKKVDGRLSLPSLSNERRGLLSRDIDGDSNGSGSRSQNGGHNDGRRGSYTIGDNGQLVRRDSKGREDGGRKKKKVKEAFSHPAGIGPWGEDEMTDGGVFKYKHRKKEDWVKYAGPSNPFEDDRRQESSGNRPMDPDKELTFEFHRSGTYSVTPSGSVSISRETTASSGDSFLISRIHSASWCECPEVDTSLLRCKECFQTGGHERWCVSKMGICPKCSKPVRRKKLQTGQHRRQSTLSPSKTPRNKSGTDLSLTSHNREECSSRRREGENRIRFHGSNSFVKESKKNRSEILKQEKGVRFADDIERLGSKTRDDAFNPALPRVDPNIHRQAYLLALADSRVKKMRRDAFAMENASKRRYFSYFPLYKHPNYKPHHNPLLGIRAEDENMKKFKIKKGMKHILGDIKLADYYPAGKKFPKDKEDDNDTTRQL